MLVALGGLSVQGEHLLHSLVSRLDQESKLLVTASEDAVQIGCIGQRSDHASGGRDSREGDPSQALAAVTPQHLSLTLGLFTHSCGEFFGPRDHLWRT